MDHDRIIFKDEMSTPNILGGAFPISDSSNDVTESNLSQDNVRHSLPPAPPLIHYSDRDMPPQDSRARALNMSDNPMDDKPGRYRAINIPRNYSKVAKVFT